MNSWSSMWNRSYCFCWREMKVTILATLSKQSRKKVSFHSISEIGTSYITLSYILMGSVDHPFVCDSCPWVCFSRSCPCPLLLLLRKKNVLAWGNLCRGQGGKRDEKGGKKFNFFHDPDSSPPVVSSLCVLCERGQQSDQPSGNRRVGIIRSRKTDKLRMN
jgi:hypothetical protein